jgi:hypothetical protein
MSPSSENINIKAATESSRDSPVQVDVETKCDLNLEQSYLKETSVKDIKSPELENVSLGKELDEVPRVNLISEAEDGIHIEKRGKLEEMKSTEELEKFSCNKETENLLMEKVKASSPQESVTSVGDSQKQTHQITAHQEYPVNLNKELDEAPSFKSITEAENEINMEKKGNLLMKNVKASSSQECITSVDDPEKQTHQITAHQDYQRGKLEEANTLRNTNNQLASELFAEKKEKTSADEKRFHQNAANIKSEQNLKTRDVLLLASVTEENSSCIKKREADEIELQKQKETLKTAATSITISDNKTERKKTKKVENSEGLNFVSNLEHTTKTAPLGEKLTAQDSSKNVPPQNEENKKGSASAMDEKEMTQEETISKVKLVKKKKKKSKQIDSSDLIEFQSVLQETPQESTRLSNMGGGVSCRPGSRA